MDIILHFFQTLSRVNRRKKMETNSRKDIRTILRRLIGQEIVISLAHFASIKEVKLWGEDRPSDFELIAVELALFKDLTAVGYCRLAQNVRRWLKTTQSRFCTTNAFCAASSSNGPQNTLFSAHLKIASPPLARSRSKLLWWV